MKLSNVAVFFDERKPIMTFSLTSNDIDPGFIHTPIKIYEPVMTNRRAKATMMIKCTNTLYMYIMISMPKNEVMETTNARILTCLLLHHMTC